MLKHVVIIAPAAENDLRTIYRYIRKTAPLAASAWVKGARSAIKPLLLVPERAHVAPEAASFDEPIRELLYGKGNRGTYRNPLHRSRWPSICPACASRLPPGN